MFSFKQCTINYTKEMHYVRAQQQLFKEWQVLHGQTIFSGDDMNIIQVGLKVV